ncbi:methyl-accepting chemotaxis protein [Bacillus tianshenii]|nr:methyl-accepting chemotaxis protein [Bacillus tianshenii]
MKSVKFKLLAIFIPILCLALLGVAWLNHNKAKEFLQQNFEENAMTQLELLQVKLDERLSKHVEILSNIASSQDINGMDTAQQMKYLKQKLDEYPAYSMFFVSDEAGNVNTTEGKTANIKDRDYFNKIINGEPYVISDPMKSKTSGEETIVFASPIKNDSGNIIGVIGTSFPSENLHALVREVKIGQTGYAFITQKNGLIISHPDEDLVLSENVTKLGVPALAKAHESVQNGDHDFTRYTFQGVDKYSFYTQLPTTGWGVFLTAPVDEASTQLSYLAKLSFVTAAVVLLIAVVIVIVFSSRMVRPIQRLSEITSRVAEGDLTLNIDHESADEIGTLGQNFNAMVKKMQQLLGEISSVSNHVKGSSDVLVAASEETKQSAEQVATAISELASGTTDIVTSVGNVTNNVSEMNHTLDNISQFAEDVKITSDESKATAHQGTIYVKDAIEKISKTNDTVKQTATIIDKVDQQSKEIGNVISIITGIAEQTNLLALNASIEAARAGDGGKGFAVVAEEVRKLAAETTHSAEQIAKIIGETQQESKRAVSSIESGTRDVEEGLDAVIQAGNAFEDITESVEKVSQQNEQINSAIRELEAISKGIGADMESISAVTEQSSASAEQVSAASQQQAAGASHISHDATKLAELSEELQGMLKQFRTKED